MAGTKNLWADINAARRYERTIKGLKSERVGEDVETQVKEFVQWFPEWIASKGCDWACNAPHIIHFFHKISEAITFSHVTFE